MTELLVGIGIWAWVVLVLVVTGRAGVGGRWV